MHNTEEHAQPNSEGIESSSGIEHARRSSAGSHDRRCAGSHDRRCCNSPYLVRLVCFQGVLVLFTKLERFRDLTGARGGHDGVRLRTHGPRLRHTLGEGRQVRLQRAHQPRVGRGQLDLLGHGRLRRIDVK